MARCSTCDTEYADQLADCPRCADGGDVHRCAHCDQEYQDADACPACGSMRGEGRCEAHPDRAAAGRCVVCGRAGCTECQAGEGRAHLCADHRATTIIEGWAQVYTTTSEFEAQLVQENLHAEGVDAQVFSQRDRIFSVDLGELSIVRVLVPVWEYAAALQVIRAHMDAEGEVVFACPSCGEPYEADAVECTACGAPLASSRS